MIGLEFLTEARGGMTTRVVDWTPSMAEYVFTALNTHGTQRSFSLATAERYRRIMEAGQWRQPWPQCCIAFSKEGQLLNGQHTLWAVWKSGLTIKINTAWNLTDSDFLLFDDFKARGLNQLAKQAGLTHTSLRNGIAKAVMALDHGMGQGVHPNVDDVIQITVDDVTMNTIVSYVVNQVKTKTRISGVALAYSLHKIAVVHGLDAAIEFFNRVLSGTNLDADDPRLHLARFLNNRTANSWVERTQIIIGIIKAFNAWVNGVSMQLLRVAGNEDIPEVVGTSPVRNRPRFGNRTIA